MLNRAELIGNIGQNITVRYTSNGTMVASFNVATNDYWTDKQTGEKRKSTEWHRVTAFDNLAANCNKFLKKGSCVYVEGKLRTNTYEKNGITHYSTYIEAKVVKFL